MATLHMGTFNVDALRELAPDDVTVYVDGDDWEEWGEPATEYRPRHVMFRGKSTADYLADIAYIMQESPGLLVPMSWEHQAGVLWTVTTDDDYSEEYCHLIDTQARNMVSRGFWHPSARETRETFREDPWTWNPWRAHLGLA